MTDIVFDGTIEGRKNANATPASTLKPGDAISMRAGDTLSISTLTLIGVDSKLARLADAAERQADALEIIAALLAACTGTARAFCPGEAVSSPAVNYLRTGDGKTFRCDATPDESDDE